MAQSAVYCAAITIAFGGAILNCKYSLCRSESHRHSFSMELAFNKRQVVDMTASLDSMISSLSMRERVRDAYWTRRDPIVKDRLQWLAQTIRHIMPLMSRPT